MNPTTIRERLQALPPDLPEVPARFESVRGRVRRRRRARMAVAALAATAVGGPLAAYTLSSGGATDRGVDPAPLHSTAPSPTDEPFPLSEWETRLSDPVTQEGNGTASVDLGERPVGATAVATELTCLTGGQIRWPDGAAVTCRDAEVPAESWYTVALGDGQNVLTIRAADGVRWRLRSVYVRVDATRWPVNENGDTYGTRRLDGSPDLVAVVATNGKPGYVYAADLERLSGGDVRTPEEALAWQQAHRGTLTPVTVYESDGETVVGTFLIQKPDGGPTAPTGSD